MEQPTLQLVRNDKKRRCSKCKSKLVDGKQVLVKVGTDGKIKEYYCKETCASA